MDVVCLPTQPPPSIDDALSKVFRQLPHLRSLTLAHMDLKCVADLGALHHPSLSALSLSYCQFTDIADLVDLVNAFPNLAELAIAGLTWKEEARPPTARPIPSLRRLALGRDVDAERLFEWFVAAELHRVVTRLEIRCASERDTDLIGPFLKLAGPALRELDLDWSFTGDKTIGLPPTMSLAECTALDTLKLQLPVHYSTALPWVSALLGTLDPSSSSSPDVSPAAPPFSPSPSPPPSLSSSASPSTGTAAIRTLGFEIRLLGSIDALDWDGLSRVLATSAAFRTLAALRVGVNLWPGVHRDIAEVEQIVRTRLAPLEKKGTAVSFHKI
ncbi:hypothetical protein BD414DRAFT_95088 [Trametes punicea]|nr:hypothetical protein BD414DRAFT_95088 [Trametes punicea]